MLPLLPLHIWSYIYRLAEKEAAATKLQAALRGLMQRRRLRYLFKYMAKGHALDGMLGMLMDGMFIQEWQSRGHVHFHHVPWPHGEH